MTAPDAAPTPPPELDRGAELMVAWQRGDEAAFEDLVALNLPRVHALLHRFLGPRAPIDDLTQEVFLRVVRARDRYEPRARFTTWLFRIVYNLAVNQTQRARKGVVSLDQGADDDGPLLDPVDSRELQPSDSLERSDLVEAVRIAIEALPDRQRLALILARYEGQPYSEIGEVLGIQEQAVKSLVHRARENLRTTLAPLLVEEDR